MYFIDVNTVNFRYITAVYNTTSNKKQGEENQN